MKRLFTFGCSFTLYNWPTWADLYGQEFGQLHYNWGYAGLGNRAIAERLAECHARMNISSNDTVIIQWTSPLRHDWLRTDILKTEPTAWRTHGSVFSKENANVFDYKWIKQFWDEKAYLIHTLNNIILSIQMLEGIGCRWAMTSMNDLTKIGNEMSDATFGGEYQGASKLKNFWDADHNLTFYKEFIWDRYESHWIDPIINVIPETEDLNWKFEVDPSRDIEKTYPVRDGKWEEAHPTVTQHAIWMLKMKEALGEQPVFIQEQVSLIKEIEEIKKTVKTFKQFEDTIGGTEWFIQRQYRGI